METPLRILVAEDEFGDVLLLKRAFAKAGVAEPVFFANDGQQALDYLAGNPPYENPVKHPLPNLLLLDLSLPELSGFQLLDWLQEQPRLRHLFVVILSASERPEDMRRAYELGARAYVVKPCNPDELVGIVQRLQTYWLTINAPEVSFEGALSRDTSAVTPRPFSPVESVHLERASPLST